MTRSRTACAVVALLLVISGVSKFGTSPVYAAGQPPGPDRYTTIKVDYTSYEWWLVQWSDGSVVCQLFTDHEGLPTTSEIYNSCSLTDVQQETTLKPCDQAQDNPSACAGDYLQLVKSSPAQKEIGVTLPPAVVWVTLEGCATVDFTHRCDGLPTLVLTGEEPLPNEKITGIAGTIDGKDFNCDPTCQVDLGPTGENGLDLQFWAYSSYGDSSEVFDAQVRVMADPTPGAHDWYVDVISSQWRGDPLAACSQTWGAFPPVGGPPAWLSTPQRPTDLASNIPYEYLAANLISQGVVDTGTCPDGGLFADGTVTSCGLDAAKPAVQDWQNRFDGQIFSTALSTGVPAQLLKNIFSRESQFWPGVFADKPEVGLGQLTDNGAETTLLWNPSFFEQYCPLVLAEDACRQGYPQLKPEQQAIVRGALVKSVDATCANCAQGIDLTQANFSISVFASTLVANCEQTGTIIHNATSQAPGDVSSYEDLWRFTLVNYNAGPGCLILAVREAVQRGQPLDWKDVSGDLTLACQGASDYVDTVTR